MGDSIKNHLGRLFNEWLRLHDYATNVTQVSIDETLEKQRNLFKNLKKNSEIQPDIDIFVL